MKSVRIELSEQDHQTLKAASQREHRSVKGHLEWLLSLAAIDEREKGAKQAGDAA